MDSSKKEGKDVTPKYRVVLDFRTLNAKTKLMIMPLPNITDKFDQLGKAKYFTVLDCVSGFH